jgi:serine protease
MNAMHPSFCTLLSAGASGHFPGASRLKRSVPRLLLAGWLGLGALAAQAMSWHLGDSPVELAAPAAINTLDLTPGPHPVVVAVIDSGVIAGHPSLADRLLPGYDMQSAPSNLRGQRSSNFAPDPMGSRCAERASSGAYRTHGTEVSSLIAGNGHDQVWGVHPQAKIVPIRVIGACGMARRDLIDAIRWAAGLTVKDVPDNLHPAQVINISLAGGSSTCNPALQEVINQVVAAGVIVVAAAGNNFHKPLQEPANCQGVVSVGAVDAKNRIEVYTALDPRTQVYAPGGGKALDSQRPWAVNKLRVATYDTDFWGRERANALDRGVGTSYAAPVVAGFIALWLSHHPQLGMADVLRELPTFLREVERIDECESCRPHGLAAHEGLIKP